MKHRYSIHNLAEDKASLKIFTEEGFNICKDLEDHDLSPANYADILSQIVIALDKTNIPKITQCGHVWVAKVRVENPNNKKGKSGGLRVMCLVDDIKNHSIPFHILSKVGSGAESNITKTQENRIIKMVKEIGQR